VPSVDGIDELPQHRVSQGRVPLSQTESAKHSGHYLNIPSRVVEIKLDMVELKLDRLIDEMRFLKSHTIAFDTRMRGIEAYLKASEPSEQQPESKSTPWLAAAASATARTVLFTVGAAVGAALTKLYLGT
jgi:hypothetical protein